MDGKFDGKGPIPMEGTTNTVTNSLGAVESDDTKPPDVSTDIF